MYLARGFTTALGLDPLVGMPIGDGGSVSAAGGVAYQTAVDPAAVERGSLRTRLLTFGVALILRIAMIRMFSPDMRNITPSYAFVGSSWPLNFDAGGSRAGRRGWCSRRCLGALLRFSGLGRAIRATAQQTWRPGSGGVRRAGPMRLPSGLGRVRRRLGHRDRDDPPFSPFDDADWTLNAFVVVVLGGVGSPAGALLGGLLLGLVSTLDGAIYRAGLPECDDVPAAGAPAARPAERPSGQRLHALPMTRNPPLVVPAVAAAGVLLAAGPLLLPPFYVRVGQLMLYLAALGLAWAILGGFAGYVSFGHSAFIGVGAFAAGLAEDRFASLPAPALLAAGAGLACGRRRLRHPVGC